MIIIIIMFYQVKWCFILTWQEWVFVRTWQHKHKMILVHFNHKKLQKCVITEEMCFFSVTYLSHSDAVVKSVISNTSDSGWNRNPWQLKNRIKQAYFQKTACIYMRHMTLTWCRSKWCVFRHKQTHITVSRHLGSLFRMTSHRHVFFGGWHTMKWCTTATNWYGVWITKNKSSHLY